MSNEEIKATIQEIHDNVYQQGVFDYINCITEGTDIVCMTKEQLTKYAYKLLGVEE